VAELEAELAAVSGFKKRRDEVEAYTTTPETLQIGGANHCSLHCRLAGENPWFDVHG